MSDEAKPGKKGKGMKMILMIVVAMVLGGAGAAGGLYAAGAFSKHQEGPREDPFKPQLVLKGESAEDVAATWTAKANAAKDAGKGHRNAAGVDLPVPSDPSKYQATYFQIQAPFTSNMSDSDAFAQISVAVSTFYDARVIQAMQTHEMAIRSSVLMLLAEQEEAALSTPQGKEALQRKLAKLINQVLKQKTGYGGVDNVYFTNFVIQ